MLKLYLLIVNYLINVLKISFLGLVIIIIKLCSRRMKCGKCNMDCESGSNYDLVEEDGVFVLSSDRMFKYVKYVFRFII